MSYRDQPNASHFSARYAERKRAAQRDRDAIARPSPCNRCPEEQLPGKIFCAAHLAEYEALLLKLKGRPVTSESLDAVQAFCERTYWPAAQGGGR